MSYLRSRPSFEGAASGSRQDLLKTIEYFHQRITDLENKNGGASFDLKAKPVATPPQPANVDIQTLPGKFIFHINPVDSKNHVLQQNVIEFSDSPAFTKVKSIPVGTQRYVEIGQFGVGASKYVRVRSSLDGTTFSKPRLAGLHTT